MTHNEMFHGLILYLFIPILGICFFLIVIKKILNENIKNPPFTEIFIVFVTYGGLLLVLLTSLFWKWSGMASLGGMYLILIAPILMGLISYKLREKRGISKYHNLIYLSGLMYIVILALTIFIAYLKEKN